MKIDIEYIRAQLQRRAAQRQLSRVAALSAVALNTVRRVHEGGGCRFGTAERLQKFLRATEKTEKLGR